MPEHRTTRLGVAQPTFACDIRADETDAAKVAGLGYRLALVGTALMRSDDPAKLIAAMCDAGRAGAIA